MDYASLPCRNGDQCRVASEWGSLPIVVTDEACTACLKQPNPSQKNEVTASLVFSVATLNNVRLDNEVLRDVASHLPKAEYPMEGPGTELTKLLAWFKFLDSAQCLCTQRAILMNSWGCEECQKRLDEIVGWLREAAEKLGIVFFNVAGRMIVMQAIANARKNGSCGA